MIDKSIFEPMAEVVEPATAEYVQNFNAAYDSAISTGGLLTEDHIGKRRYYYILAAKNGFSLDLNIRVVWEQDLDDLLATLTETHTFDGYTGAGNLRNKVPRFVEKNIITISEA